jgi:amino acid transporter
MSSAGGYYTFVSRAVHPRVGFLTAWMYVFYNPVAAGQGRVAGQGGGRHGRR